MLKYLSTTVGIFFTYEYRDVIPQIQFTYLDNQKVNYRPGLYTLKKLYNNSQFKLCSFYLDEIIKFKQGQDYRSYFKEIKTISKAIEIATQLTREFARDFLVGEKESYHNIDAWFKNWVINSH